MEKLTGLKKIKTAVFISGRGSNLKNLIKFSKTKKSPIIIDLVISNKKAFGLKYANQYKIKKKIISFKTNRIAEKKSLMVLEKENAVLGNRELMGATNPKEAEEGTIRKKYGISIDKNSVHGSDSVENAKIEIDFFFKD